MKRARSMAVINNPAQYCVGSHHHMIVVNRYAMGAHATPWFALPQLTAVCRDAPVVLFVSPLTVMLVSASRSAAVGTVAP